MDLNQLLAQKRDISNKLKEKYWFLQKNKSLWLVKLSDNSLENKLLDGLKNIDSSFVIDNKSEKVEKSTKNISTWWVIDEELIWYDFIICDDEIEDIWKYLSNWITPITIRWNHLSSILKEFDPVKATWNSYFYQKYNKWSIFASIIRYLENYKFSFDNKNLVKNIIKS